MSNKGSKPSSKAGNKPSSKAGSLPLSRTSSALGGSKSSLYKSENASDSVKLKEIPSTEPEKLSNITPPIELAVAASPAIENQSAKKSAKSPINKGILPKKNLPTHNSVASVKIRPIPPRKPLPPGNCMSSSKNLLK